jgi:hypothetical protein
MKFNHPLYLIRGIAAFRTKRYGSQLIIENISTNMKPNTVHMLSMSGPNEELIQEKTIVKRLVEQFLKTKKCLKKSIFSHKR